MSEVSLSIGGRSYKVACAEGEEAHVTRLGLAIDAKLQSMPQLGAQESQNLLFGALLLADELHDMRSANTAAQDEAAQAREALAPLRAELGRLRGESDAAGAEVARLRAQLEEAQSRSETVGAMRAELEELREAETGLRGELEAAAAAEAELRGELAGLREECDALHAQLERAQSTPMAAGLPPDDPDLAPALERFAELLESCADKLEGKAPTP